MDVRLPRLGEGADSGTVASIFVKVGDQVKRDQPILELESEKAVATIPSPSAGIVTKLYVQEGDEIKVGALVIALDADAASQPAAVTPAVTPAPSSREVRGESAGKSGDQSVINVEIEPTEARPIPGIAPPASPTVRKIARDLGIDLTRVRGSERGGRIVMQDLRNYVERLQHLAAEPRQANTKTALPVASAPESLDFSRWGPVVKKKMSTLRRTISAKMVTSWSTIPHITQFDEADITGIMDLRKTYGPAYERKGGRLTLTSFALKTVVETLKKHPMFNASIDETSEHIVLKEYYHIGIAVNTEQGLIVPVLRDVDKKSVLQLSVELQQLAEKTRERKVTLEEMQGGTFTISNQGGIGGAHFTPIINKPEVAILGMGRGVVRPVVENNEVVQRMVLPLALSYDHRIIDGADAARFMVDLVQAFGAFRESDVQI